MTLTKNQLTAAARKSRSAETKPPAPVESTPSPRPLKPESADTERELLSAICALGSPAPVPPTRDLPAPAVASVRHGWEDLGRPLRPTAWPDLRTLHIGPRSGRTTHGRPPGIAGAKRPPTPSLSSAEPTQGHRTTWSWTPQAPTPPAIAFWSTVGLATSHRKAVDASEIADRIRSRPAKFSPAWVDVSVWRLPSGSETD